MTLAERLSAWSVRPLPMALVVALWAALVVTAGDWREAVDATLAGAALTYSQILVAGQRPREKRAEARHEAEQAKLDGLVRGVPGTPDDLAELEKRL